MIRPILYEKAEKKHMRHLLGLQVPEWYIQLVRNDAWMEKYKGRLHTIPHTQEEMLNLLERALVTPEYKLDSEEIDALIDFYIDVGFNAAIPILLRYAKEHGHQTDPEKRFIL